MNDLLQHHLPQVRRLGFIPRTTFVIDKEDKIVAVFSSATDHVSPAAHVEKALAIVKGL